MPPTNKRPTSRPAGAGAAAGKPTGGQSGDPRKEGQPGTPGSAKRKNTGGSGARGAGTRAHTNGAGNGVSNGNGNGSGVNGNGKPVTKSTPRIPGPGDTTAPSGTPTPIVTAAEVAGAVALAEPVTAPEAAPSRFPLLLPKIVEAEPVAAPEPVAPEVDTPETRTKAPEGSPSSKAPSVRPPDVLPALAPSVPATVAVPLPDGAPVEFTDTDGTDGLPSLRKPKKPPRALRAPVVRPKRAPRVRRVTRVVRHVDSWSIFKVALVFNLFLYGVLMTAGVLLWQVAQNTGTVDNVERFFESFGWERFELKGGEIFHNAWVAGLFVVVGLTGLAVLMATLFNLITDLVGGIRVTVLEEEVIAREDRGLGWRRSVRPTVATPAREPEPPAPAAAGDVSQPV